MFQVHFEHRQQAFVVFKLRDLLSCLNHVPKFQRVLDEEHVSVLYRAFEDMFLETKQLNLVGEISLGRHDPQDVEYQILDGQHRYTCLKRLFRAYPACGDELIQVKLYTGSDAYLGDVYTFINSNKKVELYRNVDVAAIYSELQRYLMDEYGDYLSSAKKPYAPNINLDQLAQEIKKRDLVTKLDVKDPEMLIAWVKDLNEYYQSVPPSKWGEWGLENANEKLKKVEGKRKRFLLGLYVHYEWLDRILKKHDEQVEYRSMSHTFHASAIKRKPFPKQRRLEVWRKHNQDSLDGTCAVCNQSLDFNNFHVSHVVATALGGTDQLSNLEPCCASCNLDMGTMNLYEYRTYYHSHNELEDTHDD